MMTEMVQDVNNVGKQMVCRLVAPNMVGVGYSGPFELAFGVAVR